MGRKRFRYNPNYFDQIVCIPIGVIKGKLKIGDVIYKGKNLGNSFVNKRTYIYNKENELLGICSLGSLEEI